jgi:hypothetical protein
VGEGQESKPVSPPKPTETPQTQGLSSVASEAEQPAQLGTSEDVEAPQPQVVVHVVDIN